MIRSEQNQAPGNGTIHELPVKPRTGEGADMRQIGFSEGKTDRKAARGRRGRPCIVTWKSMQLPLITLFHCRPPHLVIE